MKRLCLGTMITLLYQSRIRHADKIKNICAGIFAIYGLDVRCDKTAKAEAKLRVG